MSRYTSTKTNHFRWLNAFVLCASIALAASCHEDRSLGALGDGGGAAPGQGGNGGTVLPGGGGAGCASQSKFDTCEATTGCSWLEPGCGQPPLPQAVCIATSSVGCKSDGDCPSGKKCTEYNINPCGDPQPGMITCGACGMQVKVCW